jgi:hypothetical protein
MFGVGIIRTTKAFNGTPTGSSKAFACHFKSPCKKGIVMTQDNGGWDTFVGDRNYNKQKPKNQIKGVMQRKGSKLE